MDVDDSGGQNILGPYMQFKYAALPDRKYRLRNLNNVMRSRRQGGDTVPNLAVLAAYSSQR